VLELFFQVLHPFTHTHHSRFKFLLVNQPISITVNQTSDPSAELAHLGKHPLVFMWLLLGLQALPVFLFQSLWVLKQSTDLLPDRNISLVHA
jgi:hypothetical protein